MSAHLKMFFIINNLYFKRHTGLRIDQEFHYTEMLLFENCWLKT